MRCETSAAQPETGRGADARHAVEDPGQFGMSGNTALVEDDMGLRIDPRGEECGGDRTGLADEVIMDQLGGNGMEIDHAIDAVVALLERDESADRAQIVAQMQITRGLHPGKDQRLELGH